MRRRQEAMRLGRPTRLIFERPGARLVGEAVGNGPSVLLLHAGGERRQVWTPVARHLAAGGFRAVAYDLRGHGESGQADASSLRSHAEDVAALVVAEPGAIAVVGASLGGLAALLALHDPTTRDEVAALVLVDVVPDPPAERVQAYLNRVAPGLAARPLVTDVLGRRDELRAVAAGLPAELPVTLIRAGRSPLTDEDEWRLAQLVPHLRVKLVPGAGHLVARDAPFELAAAILEILLAPNGSRTTGTDHIAGSENEDSWQKPERWSL